MKNKRDITTIEELRAEIARLKVLKYEQESYLGDQFTLLEYKLEAPTRLYNRITSWIPAVKEGLVSENKSMDSDWVTNSLRVGLPFIFNKVLFRKAGFIKKGLLLLASQQAATFINKDRLADVINTISSFIKPSKRKKQRKGSDYGIPPDSETY